MQTILRKQTIPIALFFFFSGFYLLTTQGIISSSDGIINFLTVRALAETHSFMLDVDCELMPRYVQTRPDGQCYGKYDVGLALTGLPLYMIGRLLDGAAPADFDALSLPRLFVSALNPFVTAVTGAILYLLAFELSASQKNALELAVLFGLVTIAWPYTVTYFSQPLVGLLLLTAVLWLRIGPSVVLSLGAGIALGWAILTRLDALPLVFIVFIYATYQFQTRTSSRRDLFMNILALTGPLVSAVVLFLLLNYLRNGGAFQNSYAGEGWTGNVWQGIYGFY
ncbi:MAG: hypothetical protein GY796_35275 [Chloroflexi bacterium]|nr:hypothetical protein [Chloroflexota bacterium]